MHALLALLLSGASAEIQAEIDSPLVLGSNANVDRAETAARKCGVTRLYQIHYKVGRSVLYLKARNKPRAVACVLRWVDQNSKSFDPLLGVE